MALLDPCYCIYMGVRWIDTIRSSASALKLTTYPVTASRHAIPARCPHCELSPNVLFGLY